MGHFVAGEEMGHFVAGTICRMGRKWDILSSGTICRPKNAGGTICRWDKMSPNHKYFQVGTEELQGSKSNENLAKLSKGECWAIIDFFNIL